MVPSDGTREWTKTETQEVLEVLSKHWEKICSVWVTDNWERMPRGCGVPILRDFLKLSGRGHGQPAVGGPTCAGKGWSR